MASSRMNAFEQRLNARASIAIIAIVHNACKTYIYDLLNFSDNWGIIEIRCLLQTA